MKLWWHRITHWEYWPVYVVYMPTFFFWLLAMIRFRSLRFFKYSNPAITNGGLYADSKMMIYQLLDKKHFPKTLFIQHKSNPNFIVMLTKHSLGFPLIVKPDVGLRGIGVKIINSITELDNYNSDIGADYLIQEYVSFQQEIGLFYCRMPDQIRGNITGITIKKHLTVVGNGTDTLKTLLMKNPRFEMQIPKLMHQIDLNMVIPLGIEKCLVPFGNHSRGALFLDGTKHISKKLEQVFNQILDPIDGFYYGRLDVKFNTFDELENGLNFSIIEINGAKSEPTHIYDPGYNFWDGQREIFKHQKLMMQVIAKSLILKNSLKSSTAIV